MELSHSLAALLGRTLVENGDFVLFFRMLTLQLREAIVTLLLTHKVFLGQRTTRWLEFFSMGVNKLLPV